MLDLARQVTSVLDFDELLAWLPEPVSRLIPYQALAVYLLDDKRGDLHVAHAVGYPPDATGAIRFGHTILWRVICYELWYRHLAQTG